MNVSGVKRSKPDTDLASQQPSTFHTMPNGHIVYVRRRAEPESTKISSCLDAYKVDARPSKILSNGGNRKEGEQGLVENSGNSSDPPELKLLNHGDNDLTESKKDLATATSESPILSSPTSSHSPQQSKDQNIQLHNPTERKESQGQYQVQEPRSSCPIFTKPSPTAHPSDSLGPQLPNTTNHQSYDDSQDPKGGIIQHVSSDGNDLKCQNTKVGKFRNSFDDDSPSTQIPGPLGPKQSSQEGKNVTFCDKVPSTTSILSMMSHRTNYWKDRFTQLQIFLRDCDQSSWDDYAQRLRSLSAMGRSRLAYDLEKKAITLSLEEAQEVHRMKTLNVLGVSSSNQTESKSPCT